MLSAKSIPVFLLFAASAFSQVDDRALAGKFHVVYGAYERSRAGTLFGSITFDGAGKYTVEGRSQFTGETQTPVSAAGRYRVNQDGTGWMTNPIDPLLPPLGLRLAADFATVGGSTVDSNTSWLHDVLLAVRAPARAASPAELNANFNGLTFLYAPGTPVVARTGFYQFSFDGAGKYASKRWTFHQSDQQDGAMQETSSEGAFGLGDDGSGFYTSVQGRKRIALAADGQTYIGTDDSGAPEIIYGVRAPAVVPAEGPKGRYHWIQIAATAPGAGMLRGSEFAWSLTGTLCGWEANGLARGNGWALFTDPPTGRIIDMAAMTGPFQINPDGSTEVTFGGPGTPTVGAVAEGAKAFPWVTINPAVPTAYFLNLAFPAVSFGAGPGQELYLDPAGARHHSTLSPHPSAFAPGQLITLQGTGFSTTTIDAPGFPLPTSLGGVSVNIGGQLAPIGSVSPDQILVQLPWSVNGAGRVRVRVSRGGVTSNETTLRIVPNLAALYSADGTGLGPASAFHADGSAVTAQNPARPNEVITFYGTGFGAVSGNVADGASGPQTLAAVTTPVQVQIGAVVTDARSAGMDPGGYPGVYRIEAVVPAATPAGNQTMRILQGYGQTHAKVTIAVTR